MSIFHAVNYLKCRLEAPSSVHGMIPVYFHNPVELLRDRLPLTASKVAEDIVPP